MKHFLIKYKSTLSDYIPLNVYLSLIKIWEKVALTTTINKISLVKKEYFVYSVID